MNVDYNNWSSYLIELINKNPKGIKLLDAGCGTGTISNLMAKQGFTVTGVDSSTAMLNMAWKHVKPQLQFVHQNIQQLNLSREYDVIISTCDVFNYITTEKELLKTLTRIYDHLDYDGVFLFDISSYNKLKNFLGNNNFSDITNDVGYIWDNFFDDESNILNMQITFFMPYEETGLYYRCDEEHYQRAWSITEIVAALVETGFKSIKAYDAFTFDPPTESSDRIQFVAYKKDQKDIKYLPADINKEQSLKQVLQLPNITTVEQLIEELKKATK
ncbi:class I SAM-dependent methyltransferase [Clostridium sp. 'deep sea']|uniref:class I SAM-dependent methyltransferase n=1 Tax=Clostridium sp. 'deep sea' TaxID=2779445 RepID=UPI001896475E|nr:class I SAM-dependent methyltransferase [Clostridium sp. 'deep sea']QOR36320.1 class I SAM-dependent methyltransferase [Clostridium sp. 'deep sea']